MVKPIAISHGMASAMRPNPRRPMFAMGWSRTLLKDFIDFCISWEKYFNSFFNLFPTRSPRNWWDHAPLTCPSSRASYLVPHLTFLNVFGWLLCKIVVRRLPKATISFIFFNFLSPQLPPQTTWKHHPYIPSKLHLIIKLPPITNRNVFWLVVVYRSIVWCRSTATECIFAFYFLSLESSSKSTSNRPPPTFCRGRICSKIPIPSLVLFLVGCCIGWPLKAEARSFSLSFSLPHLPPKMTVNSHPHTACLEHIPSSSPPPSPSQPTFSWLLCLLTKKRPP